MSASINEESLVTVICLCYNHEKYVYESLQSIREQSFKNIEIIIVNDKSTDNSAAVIKKWLKAHNGGNIKFINNQVNLGHTKSFNKALIEVKGDFIIDLAADDILHNEAIINHLKNFERDKEAGVSFSNVESISEKGKSLSVFYNNNSQLPYIMNFKPESGNLYNKLLAKFYVNACGMCVKKEVYDFLNGYDEELDYEDFDFWVRSSFVYNYIYGDFISVKRRLLENSHSSLAQTVRKNQFTKDKSTFKVCIKAYNQNKTIQNFEALTTRIIHEFKIAVKTGNFLLGLKYGVLYLKTTYKKSTI